MELEALEKHWQVLSSQMATEMAEWREQNPRATLQEIEAALDERMNRLRARMLEEAAQASAVRDWTEAEAAPSCPECGEKLKPHTLGKRQLQTHGGEMVRIERRYGVCPKCGAGIFPPG